MTVPPSSDPPPPPGDSDAAARAQRMREEQEAAAAEDLAMIAAMRAGEDDAVVDERGADEQAIEDAPAEAIATDGGNATSPSAAGDGSGTSSGTTSRRPASADADERHGTKRPPEAGGSADAEDAARHDHPHHGNHEWLAERHAHTRIGNDFQVAALPTPHPHQPYRARTDDGTAAETGGTPDGGGSGGGGVTAAGPGAAGGTSTSTPGTTDNNKNNKAGKGGKE